MEIILNLFALNIIIAVHEYGHFWQAKRLGETPSVLSIGVGLKLFSKTHQGTAYTLSLLPIGGYVDINIDSMDRLSRWGRIKILLAGPVANMLYCCLLAIPLILGPFSHLIEAPSWFAVLFAIIGTITIFFLAVPLTIWVLINIALAPIEGMEGVGGPITIIAGGEALGIPAMDSATWDFLTFSYVISLAIGTFNLIPLSFLDGGQIAMQFMKKGGLVEKCWVIGTGGIFVLFVVYVLGTDIYKLFLL